MSDFGVFRTFPIPIIAACVCVAKQTVSPSPVGIDERLITPVCEVIQDLILSKDLFVVLSTMVTSTRSPYTFWRIVFARNLLLS